MALNAPRDTREWMQSVERRLRESRSGVPVLVGQVVGEVKDRLVTDLNRTPDKPVELQLQTAIYTETVSSRRWARVLVDFPDVTRATDGTTIVVSHYELWGKDVSGGALSSTTSAVAGVAAPGLSLPGLAATPANKAIEARLVRGWVLLTTSTRSSLEKDAFLPGSVWVFRARAIGVGMSVPGEWSEESVLQLVADSTPPAQPTEPILSVVRGTIQVRWDGMAVNGSMSGDFRYLEVAHGTASSPENIVTRFYRGGGLHVASGFGYYVPQFFRFRAVDESGNRSPWSAQAVGYATPMVDEDVILSTIDAAKTHLKNIDAGVSILPNSVITEHLVVTEEMTAALAAFLHVRAGMIEANAVEADNIAAGAISASKLEADLALITAILAGNPLGTHARMDQYGFRVFAEDKTDGIPNEVVRMGVASTDDYFAITRANGTLAATISQDGVGSFTELNATDKMYYKGNELSTYFETSKIIARGYRSTNSVNNAAVGMVQPYMRIDRVPIKAGHLYEIFTGSPVRVDKDAGATGWIGITYNSSTTDPNVQANTGSAQIGASVIDGAGRTSDSTSGWIAPTSDGWASFLFVFASQSGGQIAVRSDVSSPFRMLVRDHGVDTPLSGISLDGPAVPNNPPPAPPPPRNNYVNQFGCVDSRSYDGGNNFYNYNTGKVYQGLSPAGYGNLKSMSIFNDMTAALAGADINYIRVYFNFNHWYYNSGGTARIGLHGHGGVQGSFSSNGVVVESGGWPKPGARWVDIPSAHWWGFKSGAYRGVTLEGDGGYGTYGYADRPVIEISYTK